MSMKYYNGYKLPKDKLCEFMDFLDEKCSPIIEDNLFDLYKKLSEHAINNYCIKRKLSKEKFSERWLRELTLIDLVNKGTKGKVIDIFDIRVEWNFWFNCFEDSLVGYEYGPRWIYREVDYPSYVESFGYWSNSEKPEEISQEEWSKRCEIWTYISKHWNEGRLAHVIMDIDSVMWERLKMRLRDRIEEYDL